MQYVVIYMVKNVHTCFTKTNTWIVLSIYLKVELLITQNVKNIEGEWAVQ